MAKKDTISRKFHQKTLQLGSKREVNLQRSSRPNLVPKWANKKGWDFSGEGGNLSKTYGHRSIVPCLDFTLASKVKRNFELNLQNSTFLFKPGVSLYSRLL